MAESARPAPYWRIILAGILDFITAFALFGWLVGRATGQLTPYGFSLSGWAALFCFALIVAYFIIGGWLGGTLWRRILRIPPR
jgi:hypothetical protein